MIFDDCIYTTTKEGGIRYGSACRMPLHVATRIVPSLPLGAN